MRIASYLVLVLLLITPGIGRAQRNLLQAIRPDYLHGQFAGNTGFISGGLGYLFFNRKLHVSVLDGYTPAKRGLRAINTVNIRAAYDLYRVKCVRGIALLPYTGLTGMFETSGHGYYQTPDRYPNGYYRYSAVHALFFIGAKAQLPLTDKGNMLEVFAETGTLDSYVYFVAQNRMRGFTRIFSASLGAHYYFAKKR